METTAALSELAWQLKNLTYREMEELAAYIFCEFPTVEDFERNDVVQALLIVSDKLDGTQ